MLDELYDKYVKEYLYRLRDEYGMDYDTLNYYWKTLGNGCMYVYKQGSKKGCRCGEKVKKLGDIYCRVHSKKKLNIVLTRNNTLNKWWHPKSTLVFDDSKRVIGYYNKGLLCELTDKMKQVCNTYRFKYN